MNKKIVFTIILGLMLLANIMVVGQMASASEPTYEYHDPIIIASDSDFTSENGVSSGSGTEADPYIIEGFYINATELPAPFSDVIGIIVGETTMHFTIKDCYIQDPINTYPRDESYGIVLYDLSNGSIDNCHIYNCIRGIWVEFSNNISITNSFFEENGDKYTQPVEPQPINMNTGIHITESLDITIMNNIFYNNYQEAISSDNSENTKIIENTFDTNGIGVVIDGGSALIHHNNFMNINSTLSYAYDESAVALWDDGAEGNYWDDYLGEDADGDGIGDEPYFIEVGVSGTSADYYPLMEQYVWEEQSTGTVIANILIALMPLIIILLFLKLIINYVSEGLMDITKDKKGD